MTGLECLLPLGVLCGVLAVATPILSVGALGVRWARGRRFRAVAARGRDAARRLGHAEQAPDAEGRVWFVGTLPSSEGDVRMAWCRTLRWYPGGADVSHNKDIFRVVVERDGELPAALTEPADHDAVWKVRTDPAVSRNLPAALHPTRQVWVFEVIDHGQPVDDVLAHVQSALEPAASAP